MCSFQGTSSTSVLPHLLGSHKSYKNFFKEPGSHLLSHAVSSIVPSAAQVLTIVFGMGTGVPPKRITTGKGLIVLSAHHFLCASLRVSVVHSPNAPYANLSKTFVHASMLMFFQIVYVSL